MTSTHAQCIAVTEMGTQCLRNATIDGYCRQHYRILFDDISADVMKDIVSSYIEYDELKELSVNIQDLHIDPARIVRTGAGGKYDDYTIKTYIDGILRRSEVYEEGVKILDQNYGADTLLNGVQRSWYEDGDKESMHNYVNGVKHGVQWGWYPDFDNSKQYREHYVNGLKEGRQIQWYENGHIMTIKNYSDDKLNGVQRGYYENGNKQYKYNYINGLFHGLQQVWSENGTVELQEHWVNGTAIGSK